jgi:hypothetical protein
MGRFQSFRNQRFAKYAGYYQKQAYFTRYLSFIQDAVRQVTKRRTEIPLGIARDSGSEATNG